MVNQPSLGQETYIFHLYYLLVETTSPSLLQCHLSPEGVMLPLSKS